MLFCREDGVYTYLLTDEVNNLGMLDFPRETTTCI